MTVKRKQEEEISQPVEQVKIGKNPDRVVFGASRKVSDGNYGSYDFHCSLSTDVQSGESNGDAVNRAATFVEKVIYFKITQGTQGKLKY